MALSKHERDAVYIDYCSRRFKDNEELSKHHGITRSALEKTITRGKWVQRRAELESHVFKAGSGAPAVIEGNCDVVDSPLVNRADAIAARRIEKRLKLSNELDDLLADEVEHTVKRLPETRAMPLQTRLGILETAARVKANVLGAPKEDGEHNRSVAILIGFVPTH